MLRIAVVVIAIAVVIMICSGAILIAAPAGEVIDVTSFSQLVKEPGTDGEDWQPAFQAAVEVAREQLRPIYVPAGRYKIRKPIVIEQQLNPHGQKNIRIFGDGQFLSAIIQQVDTENVIDWTGREYEKSAYFGQIENIGIWGGAIGLNLKWHNYFKVDSCYIHGPSKYGIYAEGWSNRILNCRIRWCNEAGIRVGGHWNDSIIRDCYLSRNGIGIKMINGNHGDRIEGCGIEVCAKAAIYIRGAESITINNCYFEGNGRADMHPEIFDVQGFVSTIHLDYACRGISIHDNIFRPGITHGPAISLAYCLNGHIYDNLVQAAERAILLREACETNDAGFVLHDVVVERNTFLDVEIPLLEAKPGLIVKALEYGSELLIEAKRTCEGNPNGSVAPQAIGEEVLDTTNDIWYKSVGATASDWVQLN